MRNASLHGPATGDEASGEIFLFVGANALGSFQSELPTVAQQVLDDGGVSPFTGECRDR